MKYAMITILALATMPAIAEARDRWGFSISYGHSGHGSYYGGSIYYGRGYDSHRRHYRDYDRGRYRHHYSGRSYYYAPRYYYSAPRYYSPPTYYYAPRYYYYGSGCYYYGY
jgi:hypothetical protein